MVESEQRGRGARPPTGHRGATAIPHAPVTRPDRADDLLRAQRLALTGGSAALLRWLAARTGGWTGLVGPDGTVLDGSPAGPAPAAAALLAGGAAELTTRGVRSAVLDAAGGSVLLYALEEPADLARGRALAAVLPGPCPPPLRALLADSAVPLALALRAEDAGRRSERAALAESRSREAVLHLLMNGRVSTAHQVAEALTPGLPDPFRMYVVEVRPGRRAEVTRLCEELTGGRAWIVRCPVYVGHLIAMVPEDPVGGPAGRPGPARDPLAEALSAADADSAVGVSERVPLREAPAAYTQAFHALAVARGRPERHARFGSGPELALAAHRAGADWARRRLAPLHGHRPRRPQDPGAQELRATLHAWLNFSSHATRLLKVHRNTLSGRLRQIEEVLGADLGGLADQAALSLALRLTPAGPAEPSADGGGPGPAALDEVLRHPDLVAWSRGLLAPLTGDEAPPGARETLRVWLAHEARLTAAAAALGLSVPGARKRLTRLEAVLGRSLLRSPSARHDLWLAHRVEELTEG
ncbi:helix-turn-helix domain-containing protein [Streptomyces sp. NPDC097619]|uniref:PucR family transcriptional regulator n=1 Tax=Streptomyces sp. NPDC097619 TaxID=3157228 RepID=UPI00332E02EA